MLKIGGILPTPCNTIETKKRNKNQVTKHKTVRKKRKTKKRRKSRKGTERLPKRRAREQDVIFTALVRMDENDSRIPVLFSLTSSCAAGIRSLRSMVTSFQVTSFHPLVTSFHRRVTSFQSIVSSYQGEN